MKRIIYFAAISILLFSKCSRDDNIIAHEDYLIILQDAIMVHRFDISAGTSLGNAGSLCVNSRVGDMIGWRLPTEGELQSLYQRRRAIGGFSNALYWSSTEVSDTFFRVVDFSNGAIRNMNRHSSLRARCVRTIN